MIRGPKKDAEIARLLTEIDQFQLEAELLRAEIVARDDKIVNLDGDIADAKDRITALEIENAALLKDKEHLTALNKSAREEIAGLAAEIVRLQQRNTALEYAHIATRDALDTLKSQHETLLAQHENLHADILALHDQRLSFFAEMADVLAGVEGIIVGDDFIRLETEVFFRSGSAEVSRTGHAHLALIAEKVRAFEVVIPDHLTWFLQIDGHTDIQPIRRGSRFRDNWQLSTERALSVLAVLADQNVNPSNLAAAGYGEFQPVTHGQDAAALAKNRRIELRITN